MQRAGGNSWCFRGEQPVTAGDDLPRHITGVALNPFPFASRPHPSDWRLLHPPGLHPRLGGAQLGAPAAGDGVLRQAVLLAAAVLPWVHLTLTAAARRSPNCCHCTQLPPHATAPHTAAASHLYHAAAAPPPLHSAGGPGLLGQRRRGFGTARRPPQGHFCGHGGGIWGAGGAAQVGPAGGRKAAEGGGGLRQLRSRCMTGAKAFDERANRRVVCSWLRFTAGKIRSRATAWPLGAASVWTNRHQR
jgi:hypothetical protein